jgi:leucyl aminopeptidase
MELPLNYKRYAVSLHWGLSIFAEKNFIMLPLLNKLIKMPLTCNQVILLSDTDRLDPALLTDEEINYIHQRRLLKKDLVAINRFKEWVFLQFITPENDDQPAGAYFEKCRKAGDSILSLLHDNDISDITVTAPDSLADEMKAYCEGLMLGNYQFIKYRADAGEKSHTLRNIHLLCDAVSTKEIDEINMLCKAVYKCRDLVNEPLSAISAVGLAESFEEMGSEAEIKVDILTKKKIEALKMGGLLAVNKGSLDPPTFTIMEWKPDGYLNSKPLIFVGKGVVYDTGGLSLKTNSNMETMKCDMAGAAAAACAIYLIALTKLPLHIIALLPATDNRPDGNAYVPGDVITMFDGTTVEVMNTDAEGRLLLADALSYAKKYEPGLVIDIATLTGAADAAVGKYGIVAMSAKASEPYNMLQTCGEKVYERIAPFPFWDDYAELLKSEIADIRNIGGPKAGAITAGKFLEHFTDFPWIHLDIAGPAFLDKRDSYRGQGGSGTGVRLFFEFAKRYVSLLC